ncbi:MAG: Bug family tripartite tricarboxylate transporter substrate binding protein [Xanthobacteraceae bacterium]
MRLRRREALHLASAAVAFPAVTRTAAAQSYPSRPVRVIVPFAPGGPVDVLARIITERLSLKLGQQFYVESQPGAGGNIGMGAAARANPNGYTVAIVGPSFVVNPSLYAKIPYDPLKDFAPVTLAAVSANLLVVHPSVPATTVRELIAFLKENSGKYSFAHPGRGTTAQLSGEMFRRSQKLDIEPVSFNGSAPAIQSALGGHTPIAFTVITPAVPQVKEGKLRALAVTTPKRSQALPEVPTLAQAGLPDQEADSVLGVLVPAGTPHDVVELLHREVSSAIKQLDAEGRLAALGFDPIANTPEEYAARIRADILKWAEVIRTANITAE